MTLEPREYFTVVRQLDDPYDTDTYYVRAVIRNARTDAVIETALNLTDRGSQRFSNEWQVPADTSGLGFYIIVETTVYTDSGYTTKSARYGIETREYLVQRRRPVYGGGGGGVDVNYDKIQKMIDAAVKSITFPESPDLTPTMRGLTDIQTMITGLPTPKDVDFSSVLSEITRVRDEIKSAIKDIPEPPELDLSPVQEQISEMKEEMMEHVMDSVKKLFSDVKTIISEVSPSLEKKIQPQLDAIKEKMTQEVKLVLASPQEKKEEAPKRRYNL